MKLLYIAGRYRGRNQQEVSDNVEAARYMGKLATEKGWMPVIPHTCTHGMEHVTDTSEEFWLEGTLELMKRCDAVLMVPGWRNSRGSCSEMDEAERLEMPIYTIFEEMPHA